MLLKPEDLASVARGLRDVVEPEVKAAVGGGEDFWERFERILSMFDRMLTKYYAVQDSKGGQKPATMEDFDPRSARNIPRDPEPQPTVDGDARMAAAGAIFDTLSGYMTKVPMASMMTVDQLSDFMKGNRDELVTEIAKGLEGSI